MQAEADIRVGAERTRSRRPDAEHHAAQAGTVALDHLAPSAVAALAADLARLGLRSTLLLAPCAAAGRPGFVAKRESAGEQPGAQGSGGTLRSFASAGRLEMNAP